MKTHFLLIRHTEFDKTDNMNDYPGPSLNDFGKTQSMQLCEYLAPLNIDSLFSSDFYRCKETVKPFLEHRSLSVEYLKDLRERNPDKESHQSLNDRVKAWFEIEKTKLFTSNCIVIAHCGSCNMILEEIDTKHLPLYFKYEDEYHCHTPKAGFWHFLCDQGQIVNYQLITHPYK